LKFLNNDFICIFDFYKVRAIMDPLRILLIEDDGDDIDLLKEAFDINNVNCLIDVVMEGDKAIPFLEGAKELPHVIVMDLNLPKLHGREILAQIRASKNLSEIPLIVLTTSSLQDDIRFSYSMGAKQYITKPNTMEGFHAAVRAILSVSRS
jgi:DNA-binding response OmpR family regulator